MLLSFFDDNIRLPADATATKRNVDVTDFAYTPHRGFLPMITNEQQFRIAKAQTEKFKFSITNFDMESLASSGTDRLIAQAQLDQLQSE